MKDREDIMFTFDYGKVSCENLTLTSDKKLYEKLKAQNEAEVLFEPEVASEKLGIKVPTLYLIGTKDKDLKIEKTINNESENKVLVINPDEISKEIIDLLVKHKVTMVYLDQVLDLVKYYANTSTLIQNTSFFKED